MPLSADPTTAVHEAAHAVVAIALGLPLRDVNVKARTGVNGEARLTGQWVKSQWKLAVFALSGPIAERKLRCSAQWHAHAAGDLQVVRHILETTTPAHKSIDSAWDQLETLAAAQVEIHWVAIQRVAAELSWKGELPASRVKQLMEAKK